MRRLLLLPLFSLVAFCQTEGPASGRCRSLLDRALKDRNPDTRKEAVRALSLAALNNSVVAQLESMLDDKDFEVRLATVASLSDQKNKNTIPDLQRALQDSVPEVAYAAAKALYELQAPEGKTTLLSVLGGETKTSSGFLKTEIRDGMRLLHTPRTMLMLGLKQGIGLVPVPGLGEGLASLQGLLSDSGVSGRATAALLLGRDKDPQTVEMLRKALADKDWSVRAAAIHALSLQNNKATQPEFVPLVADDKMPVRLRAAAAYLRLDAVSAGRRPARPGAGKSH